MSTDFDEIDDVGQALRENRPLKAARAYRISLALDADRSPDSGGSGPGRS
jgi:hypothetical protein